MFSQSIYHYADIVQSQWQIVLHISPKLFKSISMRVPKGDNFRFCVILSIFRFRVIWQSIWLHLVFFLSFFRLSGGKQPEATRHHLGTPATPALMSPTALQPGSLPTQDLFVLFEGVGCGWFLWILRCIHYAMSLNETYLAHMACQGWC